MKNDLYPLTFEPIFKERIWGGRQIEALYKKPLPAGLSIGESWEISDRPGDASVIREGKFKGRDLRWLMEHQREEVMGSARALAGRFPLLVKILDARETLSLQVHPPVEKARELGGEPKTEMWYVAHASPEAELYVGLKAGTTRQQFEEKLATGTVAECFHRIQVQEGSVMFLPSGRVHALGGGLVIFEIQQNSDTTYRVFDWNRLDASGKSRELHLSQSLQSIDFNDFEPSLIHSRFSENRTIKVRYLVNDPLFRADALQVKKGQRFYLTIEAAVILGVLEGNFQIQHANHTVELGPGGFTLLPAALQRVTIIATRRGTLLQVQPG